MKSMFGMCFNWKVLVGLGAVAAGVLIFAPQAALAVLPLLLLAACPLSMVVMMFAMRGMGSKNHDAEPSASPDPSVESLRARLAVVKDEERQLERELSSRSDESSDTGSGTPSTSPRAASS